MRISTIDTPDAHSF